MLIPVIMSGGAGTRLWPVSREMHPKPFMRLGDGSSLLQKTMQRAIATGAIDSVLTITNRELYFKTRDEYEELPETAGVALEYILEPCGRNTAPAVAIAAMHILDTCGENATMLVLPADHLIEDHDEFALAVDRAQELAGNSLLVTFGIQPDRPEMGFGYIEIGSKLDNGDDNSSRYTAFRAESFVEKPDLATAESYLASKRYLWNSGMFCFRPAVFLEELKTYAADVYEATRHAWDASRRDARPLELDSQAFSEVPDISIDYAVMEKSQQVAVVSCDFAWTDIGSWQAYSCLYDADETGNRVSGEVLIHNTTNCYISSDNRLVATVGVDNLVIVDTPDALLVADSRCAQDVREIARQLKVNGHEAYKLHMTVHRPWGTYTVLEEGPRFKMKRICVRPGASLSLQYHHHRSEHWVVVSGSARVDDGEHEQVVQSNESTYIPEGKPHRLSNPGSDDLVIIEIQCGDYLGEDDIVRLDDIYGRCAENGN